MIAITTSLACKAKAVVLVAFSTTPAARQVGLRIAYASVAVVVVLGLYVLLWLFQLKDLGITINWTGELLSVQSGTRAAEAGVEAGDYVSFEDFQNLKRLSAGIQVGQLVEVTIWRHGVSVPRIVTLEALQSPMPQVLGMSVESGVGILFACLGLAPLVARRRTFSLWLFFFATQVTALFLITDVPRAYHQFWAEIIAYITLPLFPALVFHFHTLFPQPTLGRWRRPLVALVYIVSAVLLPLDLISLWDYSFYLSDGWQLVISMYQAFVLLACVGLLVRTYVTTRDPKIRAQLKIITLCSGVGLVVPALLVVPMVMLDLDVNDILKSVAVFAALAVPAGYAYSMLRYNLLIGGVLYRPRLVRVIYTSVFSLGLVAFIVFSWPSDGSVGAAGALTGSSVLAAWAGIVLVVVALAAIQEWLGQWMETHLLKGGTYVDLLASATNDLQRFHDLQEYVRFFTETLLARLKSIGSLVFLTEGSDGLLTLQGHSPSLRLPLPKEGMPAVPLDSELGEMMQSANGPVSLSTLLMPHSPPFSASDAHLLEVFTILRIEWLLPLVSGQRPRPQLIGLVALGAKETDETYSAQELTALAALARTASIAAENVLMFDALEKRVIELDQEREFSAALARDVSAAQEKERTRLSSEIHDTVLQEMGVALQLLTRLRVQLQQALGGLEDSEIVLERFSDPLNAEELPPIGARARREIQDMLMQCQSILGAVLGEGFVVVEEFEAVKAVNQVAQQPDALSTLSYLSYDHSDGVDGKYLVEDVLSLVRAANQRLREICTNLHPAYLDVPLVKTLSRSVERLGQLYRDVRIEIEVHGLEPANLGDTVKDICKKITELSIHNALNHAQPSSVRVELTFTNTGDSFSHEPSNALLMLSIVDDGVGFEPRTPRYWRSVNRHGLANMYESAALIGGSLHIRSGSGLGTCVDFHIPLPLTLDTVGTRDPGDTPRARPQVRNPRTTPVASTSPSSTS